MANKCRNAQLRGPNEVGTARSRLFCVCQIGRDLLTESSEPLATSLLTEGEARERRASQRTDHAVRWGAAPSGQRSGRGRGNRRVVVGRRRTERQETSGGSKMRGFYY